MVLYKKKSKYRKLSPLSLPSLSLSGEITSISAKRCRMHKSPITQTFPNASQ
jgi:hypothetical protein